MTTDSTPVAMEANRPTSFAVSGRVRGMRATTTAAMAGSRISVLSNGKPTWAVWVVSAANISAPRPREVDDPSEQHDGSSGHTEGVVPDEAGLQFAQAPAANAHAVGYPVHGTVDVVLVEVGGGPGDQAAAGAEQEREEPVDAPRPPQHDRLEL